MYDGTVLELKVLQCLAGFAPHTYYILSKHRFRKNSTKLFYLFEIKRNILNISRLKKTAEGALAEERSFSDATSIPRALCPMPIPRTA